MENTERTSQHRRSGAWRADALYAALAQLGAAGWHDRQAIATHLGKQALNTSEKAALERLVEAGRAERRIVAAPASVFNQRLEYRVIETPEGTG